MVNGVNWMRENETIYWLELLRETNYLNEEYFDSLNEDAIEIIKLTTAILRKAKIGTALYDFQPSGNDRIHAQTQRKKNPNAQFFIFSPLLNKENYNKAVEGKYMQPNIPYKKIDYEPSKFIPY